MIFIFQKPIYKIINIFGNNRTCNIHHQQCIGRRSTRVYDVYLIRQKLIQHICSEKYWCTAVNYELLIIISEGRVKSCRDRNRRAEDTTTVYAKKCDYLKYLKCKRWRTPECSSRFNDVAQRDNRWIESFKISYALKIVISVAPNRLFRFFFSRRLFVHFIRLFLRFKSP